MIPVQEIQAAQNPIREYITALIVVTMIAVFWVIMNEVVMGVGSVTIDMVEGTAEDLAYTLIDIYRITPIAMVIAVWVWCFYRAFKREPFEQFGGI
jgi:uncharacterized BrkB/YihY/UPF0761 family membrane protein